MGKMNTGKSGDKCVGALCCWRKKRQIRVVILRLVSNLTSRMCTSQ
jgi:hypothetical protein